MISTSIFCVRRDVELVLEALNSFGEFHVEQAAEEMSLAEYNQRIQQLQQSLSDANELTKQLITEKPSFTDIFKVTQPAKTAVTAENWQALQDATSQQISALKKNVDDLNTSLLSLQERAVELSHTKNMLLIIERMGADFAAMEKLKLIRVTVASVPHKNLRHLQGALAAFPAIIHRCYLSKETDFLCLATPNKYEEEIERNIKTHHGEIFRVPENLPRHMELALKQVNHQLKETAQKEKQLQSTLKKLGKENAVKLAVWMETTQNILALMQAEQKILQLGHLATIKGFVPQKQYPMLTKKIDAALQGRALVVKNEPEPGADPPTLICHNRYIAPFEEITKLYGVPHYDELDPTPIIAVTFPLIFGLMFGDVGHGLLLLLGGLTLGTFIKRGQAIRNVCWILAACGVGSIAAGLVFGEFFGVQIFTQPLFDPFKDVLTFLVFSLFVGVIQILSGLTLEMVNFLLRHNVVDAALTSVPKIAFYVGSVYLVAAYQLNFAAWFNGPILLALIPFVVLVFGKPIFFAVGYFSLGAARSDGERVPFGQRLFESGDLITRLLSNTVSYTRILALLMAHWALILVVYAIAGQIGSGSVLAAILSGIIIVLGNVFVLALEGLIVFIHTLRLHFYEWFSKFYMGTGTEFTPFRQNFIYTKVKLKENQPKAAVDAQYPQA